MIIVSNSSPLINLARISKLDILRQLYGNIVIPEAVWDEVVVKGYKYPGAKEIKESTWIKVQTVHNKYLVQALRQYLGAGEAEAIALALELKAGLLLIDDHIGRETARHFGLKYIGLIGVLIEAKHKGFIHQIKPYLDALRDIAGFRIREELYYRVLQEVGED
jgi:predicted nucleic acid-binding protein